MDSIGRRVLADKSATLHCKIEGVFMRKVVGKKRRGCSSNTHKASIALFLLAISLMIWQIVHIIQPNDADIATATLLSLQQQSNDDKQQLDVANNIHVDNIIDTVDTTDKDKDTVVKVVTQQHEQHELSIQQSTLDHLQSLGSFPKKFHLIWPDKDVLNKTYDMLQHGASKMRQLNPSWEFIIHNYDDIHNTIENFNHPDVPKSVIEQLQHAHIVEKTDAFRLILIYQVGGLYSDIDRVMNVKLDDIINTDTTKLVLPTYFDINFCQDLFGSSPGNEMILNVFKKQNEKRLTLPRKNGWLKSSDHINGITQLFSNSIETELFGHTLQQSNEKQWDEARHVLAEHSNGLIITKKDVWCDGLLVNDYEGCKQVSRTSLYDAYNVTGWAAQVDAVWKEEK